MSYVTMSDKTKEKVYFQANNIYIFNDDFLTTKCVEKNSIDLIVASPPYNVDIRCNSYDDQIPYDIYLVFNKKWLKKAYNLLKFDGRFCLNVPLDKIKGGQQSVYADIVSIAKKLVGSIIPQLSGMSRTFRDELHGVLGLVHRPLML